MCRICRERALKYKDERRMPAPEVAPHRKKRKKIVRKKCRHIYETHTSRIGRYIVVSKKCSNCGKREQTWGTY